MKSSEAHHGGGDYRIVSLQQVLIVFWLCFIIQEAAGCGSATPYTTSQIVSSHDYPSPYTPGVNCTWTWRRESGIWGIKFHDVDFGASRDYIRVDYGEATPLYVYGPHKEVYSKGQVIKVGFVSRNSSRMRGKGFKIEILHGRDRYDLNNKFLNAVTLPPPEKPSDQDSATLMSILLVTATILFCLAIVTLSVCYRRRRQRGQVRATQEVSVNVNVHEIRKDSGTRYTRKTSTQSLSSTLPRPSQPVARTPSNRSWAHRAQLTGVTRERSASTPAPVSPNTVPNLYTSMDNSSGFQPSNKSQDDDYIVPVSPPAISRSRAATLEKVPENCILNEVPLSLGVDQPLDDGYIKPTQKSPPINSYMNVPKTLTSTSVQAKFTSPSCPNSENNYYQNIMVSGQVDIS